MTEGIEALHTSVNMQAYLFAGAGTPTFVPWQDHPAEPKFICDVMTEGLAKQLRLYGVDAAAVESQGKHARHLIYRSAMLQHVMCVTSASAPAGLMLILSEVVSYRRMHMF